jgi:hypothetical protein
MIDAGDVSGLMFKDFYEHFDDSISEISVGLTEHDTNCDQEDMHQFPKKYLRGKGFRKMNKTINSSEWIEANSAWSGFKSLDHNLITRDQSLKENLSL